MGFVCETTAEWALSMHDKRASETGTFCNLAIIWGFLLQTSCRRRTWKGDKALEIWTFLCFKFVLVQVLMSYLILTWLNTMRHQLLRVVFYLFIVSLGLTFLSTSNSKPPKYAWSYTTKMSLKWNHCWLTAKLCQISLMKSELLRIKACLVLLLF